MTFDVKIAEAAEEDIRNAFLWYENQQGDLGFHFEDEIKLAIQSIQNNPFKIAIRYQSIRVFFLKKFPYGIHFQVSESKILIVAVFHTAQNPERWKRK